MFSFTVTKKLNNGIRAGLIKTAHGIIETPSFVPVGTQGSVKSLTPVELEDLGVQLFFVNTYHIMLRPGTDVIKKFGGLHKFIGWEKPLITDSGGFQVFSQKAKIDDNGVTFRSHWDGSPHRLTPKKSMEIQRILGADLIIAFDDCTPYPVTYKSAQKSVARTHLWAKQSLEYHDVSQALYGVVQGSVFEDLRKESAQFICRQPFDGIAVGGVSVGESKQETKNVLEWISPYLPENKPRHLLGVGEIDDIFTLVKCGIDTFDCVMPTRLARMGSVLIRKGTMDILKRKYASDKKPLEDSCKCYTCSNFSRAYIHHLFKVRELLGYRLATFHNLYFIEDLMRKIRKGIKNNTLVAVESEYLYNYSEEAEVKIMGQFGGFYKGDKKKPKKKKLEKKAKELTYKKTFILPKVEIIKKDRGWE